ncbi:MAG: peptidoglycan DD-metalloendopeptidase family protein [Burkholderiales bacterium]|nr:peptidoglycan DD-metalloendopeptidase family protein [Burkholderiales bacterium]
MTAARAALVCLVLAATPAVSAARGGAEEEARLRELRGRIEALQKELARAEESRSEAADALRDSERAISEAGRALRELADRARTANARLAGLRADTARVERALKEQQALLARALYHRYLAGGHEPLKLLLNREDPNRIARQLHYLSYVARDRAATVARQRAALARLAELAGETGRNVREIDAIAAEQRAERARLTRERAARGKTLARISGEIRRQQREIGTLQRDEARLARLVENLARLTARERAPGAARARREHAPQIPAAGFARLKGRLALPVRGEVAGHYGAPRAGGGATWRGIFITARPGEEVRAIAPGRVVYADWLRGFGNLMIIDHGDAYMSLYGNNESLFKRVGEEIDGGETVAATGNSGGNADSGLYFELRYQGKPLDPSGWIAVK